MAARLEGSIKRFIGTDASPPVSETGDIVPAGSTYFQIDPITNTVVGIARYDGSRWNYESTDNPVVNKLDELLIEIRELKELHMAVVAKL